MLINSQSTIALRIHFELGIVEGDCGKIRTLKQITQIYKKTF